MKSIVVSMVMATTAIVAIEAKTQGDVERARALATQLRVGRVRINGAPLDKRGTHGGFKLSGVGREWGRFGIEEFLEYKSVLS